MNRKEAKQRGFYLQKLIWYVPPQTICYIFYVICTVIINVSLSVLIAIPIDVGMAYNLDRAEFFGISDINASYLLSIAGISNSLGKILVGQLTDCLRHRIFSLTFVLMLANAVTFAFSDFFPSWLGQTAGNSAFGFFLGAYSSTSAVLFKYA